MKPTYHIKIQFDRHHDLQGSNYYVWKIITNPTRWLHSHNSKTSYYSMIEHSVAVANMICTACLMSVLATMINEPHWKRNENGLCLRNLDAYILLRRNWK